MRHVREARRQMRVSQPPDVADKIGDFLRSKYPQKTADCVAADTGIGAKTVAKWLDRSRVPNGFTMLHLAMMYGPEFLCALTDRAPHWLRKAVREEKAASIQRRMEALDAERAAL